MPGMSSQGENALAALCGRPRKWQALMWTAPEVASAIWPAEVRPVAPPNSVVSLVRSPLAARSPRALRHGCAAPARHRVLPPSRCWRGWRAVFPPLLKLVQQVRQRLHRVGPLFRSTAPIGGPAISDNDRWFRRRIRGSCLAPRPVGRGSLGGGHGPIAAGWWSWHPGLISRDASRVQWGYASSARRADRSQSAGERWPNLSLLSKQPGVPS